MTSTTQQILRHFLSVLEKKFKMRKVPHISPLFHDFFTKDELIAIITWVFDEMALEQVDFENSSEAELLEAIGDDAHILGYYIHLWEVDLQDREAITAKSVWETIEQLQLHSHYLASKPIAHWDTYDHSNYRHLQLKAGRVRTVYGIYDRSIKQKEVYAVDTPPNRFYETKAKAEAALRELIATRMFKKTEVHILYRYKAM